jgi:selenocysteine lyase/cysteine desulfurase
VGCGRHAGAGFVPCGISRLRRHQGAGCAAGVGVLVSGGTVTFNLLDARGQIIDVRAVARDAAEAGISVRTGCFCNPGAAEAAFGLSRPDVARARWLDAGSTDHYMEVVGMPGGAIRASVGLASNIEDVQSFLALLDSTYRDHPPVDAERRLVSGPCQSK